MIPPRSIVDENRPWLPQAVKDALVPGNQGSRFAGTAYQAKPFRKPPLNDGEFTIVGNYLLLQMDCCGPSTDGPAQ